MAGKRYWRGPATLNTCICHFLKILQFINCFYSTLYSWMRQICKKKPEKFSKNCDNTVNCYLSYGKYGIQRKQYFFKPCWNVNFVQIRDKLKSLVLHYMFYDMQKFFSFVFLKFVINFDRKVLRNTQNGQTRLTKSLFGK